MIDARLSPGHLCRVVGYNEFADGTIVSFVCMYSEEVAKCLTHSNIQGGWARFAPGLELIIDTRSLEAIEHD